MSISDFKFQISDCRLWAADCGWPPIENPKSKIQNPPRRGASILEVLFAILVTTIGLLGAVAIFPVASAQARKSRIADATAAAGRSAVNVVETRGMRRPDMWMAWNSGTGTWVSAGATAIPDGMSFCIDPRFIARNGGTTAERDAARWFPFYDTPLTPCPRMQRITLSTAPPPLAGTPMGQLQADSIFSFDDDLIVNRFASTSTGDPIEYDRSENSRPAAQAFYRLDHDSDLTTPSIPLKRNSQGNLSWMATLVPKHEMYLGAPVTPILGGPVVLNNEYVLSIVVFNQRPLLNLSLDTPGSDLYEYTERVLGADFDHVGGVGYAGGETMLTWPRDASLSDSANLVRAKEMLKVRNGDWIMLAKNLTHADGTTLRSIYRWYRVTDAETEPEYHPAPEDHYALGVSLSGQDWEVTPGVQDYAIVVSGVVGVYEKTVRLESF